MLRSSWNRCWRGVSARGDGFALMQELISAYEEPQRKYHTTQHLSECLSLLAQHLDLAVEPGEVEIALWFHDAVYDVKANDNEAKSAAWAESELLMASVEPVRVERIKGHILATQHSAQPQGKDQQLMVDVDLSILGAPTPRFEEYEAQVRAEYEWVPEVIFRSKRKDILTEFLARRPIFNTAKLHEALEERARANLARSIGNLEQP
jgi:predicted metal-dependent HD superfamily phosphohydrolase